MTQYKYIKKIIKKMSFQDILIQFQKCHLDYKILYIQFKKNNKYLKKTKLIITKR